MKRFISALFLAAVYAEEEDDEDSWDAVKGWFKDDQEPVMYDSLTAGADGSTYGLSGKYGWYTRAGIDQVFISQTVTAPASEGGFVDGAYITSLFEMEDPDQPDMGIYESVTCSVQWSTTSASGADVDVETFEMMLNEEEDFVWLN